MNGRALDLDWLPGLLHGPTDTLLVTDAGPGLLGGPMLLGARLSPRLASAVLLDLLEQRSAAALAELRRFARIVEVDARLLAAEVAPPSAGNRNLPHVGVLPPL